MSTSETSICLLLLVFSNVFIGVLSAPAKDDSVAFEFILLHNNDMHARFEQTDDVSGTCTQADAAANKCYGGFARVANV